MLYHVRYEEVSILVDATGEGDAAYKAKSLVNEGEPVSVTPLEVGAFACEIVVDRSGRTVLEPFEATEIILDALDNDGPDHGPPSMPSLDDDECGEEAEEPEGSGVYVCSLPGGHDGDHEARGANGELLASW